MNGSTNPWVDGPYELISGSRSGAAPGKKLTPARIFASSMSCIHNSLLRGMNAVHRQCVNVAERGTDKDKLDFANFAYLCAKLIEIHHHGEEDVLFPGINELAGVPGLMNDGVEQHAVFQKGLLEYQEYLTEVKEGRQPLDGAKVKSLVESFMPAVRSHLDAEIDMLVGLEEYDRIDWAKWADAEEGKILKKLTSDYEGRVSIMPVPIVNHDKDFEDGTWAAWPPIPWPMMVLMRWLYLSKHNDWWRFSGCDLSSRRKELPFS
ncbi:hypothetical protein GE09DRAFT_1264477 [Coniochaeta sp. 2T2.1]|nr:hypothetical protein GE09DRAFT_1264477 [Coniochaeta sp. 2T2.1]